MEVTQEALEALKTNDLPYKWKVQSAKHWGCECVAYIDARQVMDLLDRIVGPANWQDHYNEVAGKVYCTLAIKVGGEWVEKSDCGTASNFEAEKGQASDAFKRAAVKWGIGRFLYALDTVRTKSIESGKDDRGNPRFYPADESGNRIYNLSDYIYPRQPVSQARRAEIEELARQTGWTGKRFQNLLKKFRFSWAGLTNGRADCLIDHMSNHKPLEVLSGKSA